MIHTGDCVEIMAQMDAASVDAIVTDPPYGLEFMGKSWDRLGDVGMTSHAGVGEVDNATPFSRSRVSFFGSSNVKCRKCGHWAFSGTPCVCDEPDFPNPNRHQGMLMGQWHQRWATEAFRVAKPGAYLLAFGGTRTYHRMTCAIEDAGWIIRDCLVWAYASGFPKSKALLKPAWEPIVMARKPGPLRELAIDACRIPSPDANLEAIQRQTDPSTFQGKGGNIQPMYSSLGRWPANLILTDPIFDGDTPGVVGGNDIHGAGFATEEASRGPSEMFGLDGGTGHRYGDSGTYSRFFLIPKADRAEREPVLTPNGHDRATRFTTHPTVKPLELMRHLVRLVTHSGGIVLDPFLGSGTTALAAEMEGFPWIGIEKEPEYVAIAEARLNGTQKGLGLA